MAVPIQALGNASAVSANDPSALAAAISATENCISSLEKSIALLGEKSGPWEQIGLVCSFVVIVGIIGELVVIVSEHNEELQDWRRGFIHPPEHPRAWRYWFDIVATVVVLMGILGESVANLKLSSINSRLRIETSELRAKSDRLVELITLQAGSAASNALTAQQSAQEAHNQLDTVKSDASAIEFRIDAARPRYMLLPIGKNKAVDLLKRYAGQKVVIFLCGNVTSEEEFTRREMLGILGKGGSEWEVQWLQEMELCKTGVNAYMQGIWVQNSTGAPQSTRDAARDLTLTLNKINVITTHQELDPADLPGAVAGDGSNSPWGLVIQDPSLISVTIGEGTGLDIKNPSQPPKHAKK